MLNEADGRHLSAARGAGWDRLSMGGRLNIRPCAIHRRQVNR